MKINRKTVLFAKNFFLQQELRGIMDFARAHDWQLEMPQLYGLPGHVRNWRGKGLLTDTPYYTQKLHEAGVHIVALSMDPKLIANSEAVVAPDNRRIGELAAEFFLRKGFHHFAMCEDYFARDVAFAGRVARNGFSAIKLTMPRYFRSTQALNKLAAALAKLPTPCGVFCNNDWEALSVINAAELGGISIPDRLSVIGCGNEELICSTTSPQISSIDSHLYERGYRAAAELDRLMEGEAPRTKPIQIAPGEIVERESSNFYAVAHPGLRKILAYLQPRFASPVQLAGLARHFRMSESKIYRLFREELGVPPKDFLTDLRLNAARTRLMDTDDTINTIAEESGFPSPGALFELFKTRYGQTPTEWRHAARGIN